MRIRSIKPSFWRSLDVAALSWDARLVFIGLWSYVDDNGVGVDRLSVIAAELFADDLAEDSRETLARLSRAIEELSRRSLIVRYTADGNSLLFVTSWDRHQKIDKPGATRYPRPETLPTSGNTTEEALFARPSRDPRETLAPGEGEKGRRGEGEKATTSSPSPAPRAPATRPPDRFDEFWTAYPRKDDKAKARAVWATVTRTTDPELVIAGARRYADDPNREAPFTKLPTTWLRAGSWTNGPLPPRSTARSPAADFERTRELGRQMQAAADARTGTDPDFPPGALPRGFPRLEIAR